MNSYDRAIAGSGSTDMIAHGQVQRDRSGITQDTWSIRMEQFSTVRARIAMQSTQRTGRNSSARRARREQAGIVQHSENKECKQMRRARREQAGKER